MVQGKADWPEPFVSTPPPPRVANTWTQSKVDERQVALERSKKASDKIRAGWVECVECKQSGRLGGHGMCQRCYARWRFNNNIGTCKVCKKKKAHIQSKRNPICTACRAKAHRAKAAAEAPELVRIQSRSYQAARRARIGDAAWKEERRRFHAKPEARARKRERAKAEYARRKENWSPERMAAHRARDAERHRVAAVAKRHRRTLAPTVAALAAILATRVAALREAEFQRWYAEELANEECLRLRVTRLPGSSVSTGRAVAQATDTVYSVAKRYKKLRNDRLAARRSA